MNSPILTIVAFLIIFTVVVVSHEFGHYLIARMGGIRVNEFSIGMGPAIFRKKGKVTEFVIRLLPIGGACIFDGEDGNYAAPLEEEANSGSGGVATAADESISGAASVLARRNRNREDGVATAADESISGAASISARRDRNREDGVATAVDESISGADGVVVAAGGSISGADGVALAADESISGAASVLARRDRNREDAAGQNRNREDAAKHPTIHIETQRPFQDAPVWSRIAAVFAGPLFNVLLAYLLALFIVWFCGADLPTVHSVMEGYPAEAAGIMAGDEIVSVDGLRTHLWREVMVRSYMNNGQEMSIRYRRGGEVYTTTLTPRYDEEAGRYYIGFSGGADYVECNNPKVFKYSWFEVRYWLVATVESLKYMFTGHASLDDLAGPVGVANIIDDTIEETRPMGALMVVVNMFNIAVLLSVNLGVLNLLPIPALDGGRLLFLLFEAVSGRKVPPDKEGIVHLIGFALLMVLMIAVLFNDIGRFFR